VDYQTRHGWESEFVAASHDLLNEHYNKYRNRFGPAEEQALPTSSDTQQNMARIYQHEYGARITARRTVAHGDELEQYYRTAREMETVDKDVLCWWKNNQKAFPVLSKMARDYLAVPGKKKKSAIQTSK
jgi:hypothetical protein